MMALKFWSPLLIAVGLISLGQAPRITLPAAAHEGEDHHHGEEHGEADHQGEDHHDEDQQGQDSDEPHVFATDGVEIIHPWTRATNGSESLVFMEIENDSGETLELIGGRSEAAADLEVVGVQLNSNGEQEFVPLGPVVIPPGDFDLDPNGVALQLVDLNQDLVEGNRLVVFVEFESLGEIRLEADIEAADATQHSHAGHAH